MWDAIRDYPAWPSWWPAIITARQVAAGGADGAGERVAFVFRTRLPYRVRFVMTTTHATSPAQLDGVAHGELEGTGRWRLRADGDETVVEYTWNVRTTRWWMNLLAPIARPLFEWNHGQVMESGRTGLTRLLAHRAEQERLTVGARARS